MRLHVSVVDGRGRPARAPGLAGWLARTAPASARGEVAIALVTDAHIRSLNRTYRHKDYATDVLSFSAGPGPYLGDIVIARGIAARQARAEGHSPAVELRVLALHGLLHLLGYDHERDRGEMHRLERRLRRKGRLGHSLIERASAPRRH